MCLIFIQKTNTKIFTSNTSARLQSLANNPVFITTLKKKICLKKKNLKMKCWLNQHFLLFPKTFFGIQVKYHYFTSAAI